MSDQKIAPPVETGFSSSSFLTPQTVPTTVGYEGLSILLHRSPGGLRSDRCRKPWTVPPACQIPGSRSPVWVVSDVLAWIRTHQEPEAQPPRRPGRPTKAEQLRRAAAAQQEGGAA